MWLQRLAPTKSLAALEMPPEIMEPNLESKGKAATGHQWQSVDPEGTTTTTTATMALKSVDVELHRSRYVWTWSFQITTAEGLWLSQLHRELDLFSPFATHPGAQHRATNRLLQQLWEDLAYCNDILFAHLVLTIWWNVNGAY